MRISEFIEWSNRLHDPTEIFDLFGDAIRDQGFTRIALVALGNSPTEAVVPAPPETSPVVVQNYPNDYAKNYFEKRRYEIDPVLLLAPQRYKPFLWQDVAQQESLTPEQRLLFKECRQGGLHDGLTIPIRAPEGQHYAICLARDYRCGHKETELDLLNLLGAQFFLAYAHAMKRGAKPTPLSKVLSERERECLAWVARGKSSWEISVIIGLSENTIAYYLKNAMKKMRAPNRVVAVVVAIRAGLIEP